MEDKTRFLLMSVQEAIDFITSGDTNVLKSISELIEKLNEQDYEEAKMLLDTIHAKWHNIFDHGLHHLPMKPLQQQVEEAIEAIEAQLGYDDECTDCGRAGSHEGPAPNLRTCDECGDFFCSNCFHLIEEHGDDRDQCKRCHREEKKNAVHNQD